MHHRLGPSAAAVRKRRKEKSLGDEEEPPAFEPSPASVTSSSSYSTSPTQASQAGPWRKADKTTGKISVIQHTSSFEKQETASAESQESEEKGRGSTALEQHQQPKPPTFSRLTSTTKEPEKTEEFQWPQRSQSLSQLPAEKLPPKKKRLRLAEAAQSSGESSLSPSPSRVAPVRRAAYPTPRAGPASFEETGKPESEYQPTATRASHVTHMLTVPSGPHQQHQPHREMRRSASEQAPTSAQHPAQIAEARSKSFDYGSLSLSTPRQPGGRGGNASCLLPPPPPPAVAQGQSPQLFPAPGISEVLSTQPSSPQENPSENPNPLLPLTLKRQASSSPQTSNLPSSEQLRPVVPLVVPVRLQSRVPTYGRAIYTALSQVLVTQAQESAHSAVVICKWAWRRERALAFHGRRQQAHALPAGSLELSVEAQRQQKAVKEEEDEEEGGKEEEEREEKKKAVQREEEGKKDEAEEVGKVKEIPLEKPEPSLKDEEGEESQRGPSQARGPDSKKGPPYPSLHTTTTVSWCYLNYVKPTPGPQRDPHSSVYSSWSISLHNPNLPGLATRTALSLLRSKQKHSPETYTMATGLHPAAGKLVSANSRKPKMSEVHLPPTHSVEEKEEEKKEKREQEASTSKRAEPSRIPIFEGG
ncbi:hypothetical protein AOXY_G38232 [Acipenser oxyrinchus oxyrinchus]|uniref:Uncharacterized protein n=1 Tax=Acipenser oxyrinchus oxyrinchus TaxID=40147 RepID=A0AAD8CFG9_ACIOX|nr:hypothetical protein AOXY_G38232 [Acipenser oxyrinchus oxyrinchus]